MVLPLLAVTWMSAVLAVTDRRSALFQILFAVFDSLEGFVIVMVHCILRREVGGLGAPRVPVDRASHRRRGWQPRLALRRFPGLSRRELEEVLTGLRRSGHVAGSGSGGDLGRPGMWERVHLGHRVSGPGASFGVMWRALRASAGGRGRAGHEVLAPGRQQGPRGGSGSQKSGISSASLGTF